MSEKQAVCEKELAAAEPLVAQAEAALDTLNKKDLGETKSLKKPPPGTEYLVGCDSCTMDYSIRTSVRAALMHV